MQHSELRQLQPLAVIVLEDGCCLIYRRWWQTKLGQCFCAAVITFSSLTFGQRVANTASCEGGMKC